MSLTRLLIVILVAGSCIPQNIEDIILQTVESLYTRQGILLEKYDDLKDTMTVVREELAQITSKNEQHSESLTKLNGTMTTFINEVKEALKDTTTAVKEELAQITSEEEQQCKISTESLTKLAEITSENEQQCNICTDSLTNIITNITSQQSAFHTVIKDSIDEQFDEHYNRTIKRLFTKFDGKFDEHSSNNNTTESIPDSSITTKPVDCHGHQKLGSKVSGVHEIYPLKYCCKNPVRVWCDVVDNDGWTVILSRTQQSTPENFKRTFQEYAAGFGNPAAEYWIGNEILHQLTEGLPTTLRVDAEDYEGNQKFAEWNEFIIGDSSSKYQLKIGKFASAMSTMGDSMERSNGAKFSTIDEDNDSDYYSNCAVDRSGGGWWYKSCSLCTPTSIMKNTDSYSTSMTWYHWNPSAPEWTSLRHIKMKIKPSNSEGSVKMCQE